jgi:hypothetical protein
MLMQTLELEVQRLQNELLELSGWMPKPGAGPALWLAEGLDSLAEMPGRPSQFGP